MSKRKGADLSFRSTSSVSVSMSSPSTITPERDGWDEMRHKLKAMRNKNSHHVVDELLISLDTCRDFQQRLSDDLTQSLSEQSESIRSHLQSRLELAREACREESDDVYRLQSTLNQLATDRAALQQELEDLSVEETETKERIRQAQQEASIEIEEMDKVEAERMRQVPRMKQQISLYATTTGIKWDFNQTHVLAGELAVQGKEGLRRFCMDPNEYSDFEIANNLWSMMENGTFDPSIATE